MIWPNGKTWRFTRTTSGNSFSYNWMRSIKVATYSIRERGECRRHWPYSKSISHARGGSSPSQWRPTTFTPNGTGYGPNRSVFKPGRFARPTINDFHTEPIIMVRLLTGLLSVPVMVRISTAPPDTAQMELWRLLGTTLLGGIFSFLSLWIWCHNHRLPTGQRRRRELCHGCSRS